MIDIGPCPGPGIRYTLWYQSESGLSGHDENYVSQLASWRRLCSVISAIHYCNTVYWRDNNRHGMHTRVADASERTSCWSWSSSGDLLHFTCSPICASQASRTWSSSVAYLCHRICSYWGSDKYILQSWERVIEAVTLISVESPAEMNEWLLFG